MLGLTFTIVGDLLKSFRNFCSILGSNIKGDDLDLEVNDIGEKEVTNSGDITDTGDEVLRLRCTNVYPSLSIIIDDNFRFVLIADCISLIDNCTLIINGCSLVINNFTFIIAGFSSLIDRFSLLIASFCLVITGFSLLIARFSLLITGLSLVISIICKICSGLFQTLIDEIFEYCFLVFSLNGNSGKSFEDVISKQIKIVVEIQIELLVELFVDLIEIRL